MKRQTRLPALICVKTDPAGAGADSRLLEGELIRRGAREAHRTPEGQIVVSVVATSHREASALVRGLLEKARGTATASR